MFLLTLISRYYSTVHDILLALLSIQLYEKNCIRKERQTADERSYRLFMTETGLAELKKGYESILQPFYDLWRKAGEDFELFMHSVDRLATHIEKGREHTCDNEVL